MGKHQYGRNNGKIKWNILGYTWVWLFYTLRSFQQIGACCLWLIRSLNWCINKLQTRGPCIKPTNGAGSLFQIKWDMVRPWVWVPQFFLFRTDALCAMTQTEWLSMCLNLGMLGLICKGTRSFLRRKKVGIWYEPYTSWSTSNLNHYPFRSST